MGLFRSTAERKASVLGIDAARLPPGQYATKKWPVLQAGAVPRRADLSTWTFRTSGLVENPLDLSWDAFRALPSVEVRCDIHCVTRWSRFDMTFRGVPFSEIVRLTRPLPEAGYVISHGEQGYTANLPFGVMDDDDVMLAYEADGEPLSLEHGYPLRLVVPKRYFWKSTKWLRGLEFSATDEPGYWENYGYHNDADPFLEERTVF
jgi:DMSO/TMAO reductase YedYZ molybdopterin-dependent catalytic subunit